MIKLELTEREAAKVLFEMKLAYMKTKPNSESESFVERINRKIQKQFEAQKEKK